MTDEFPEDAHAPVFFLSYARAKHPKNAVTRPHQVNQEVLTLFTELTANVNELLSLSPGRDPGFMDMTMDGGERWEENLLYAAGTCQVFVALLTSRYLTGSEWCAMEWDLFSRRKIIKRDGTQLPGETAIVPVLWAPIKLELPSVVSEVTLFMPRNLPDPSFLPEYEANGLYGLLRSDQIQAFKAIVWKLALHVQRVCHSYHVEPMRLATEELRRSFVTEGASR